MIYDISPTITPALAVFPGDTPPRREVLQDLERGDHLTLSTLHATVHLGAHLDAPNHYDPGAGGADTIPLERCLGPCQVIQAREVPGELLGPDDLADEPAAERILVKTGSFPDPEQWCETYTGLSPDLLNLLADAGVTLVGIDTPSVDPSTAKQLHAHQCCRERDLTILEGLVLDDVPPGHYELIALPLPLEGFDASPVRAILRTLPR